MQHHPVEAAEALKAWEQFDPAVAFVARDVRHHHERWDGSGYPDGLAGESIPLGARVIAVVDAFHAMVSARPYRIAGMPAEVARKRLIDATGRQFDSSAVDAFLAFLNSPDAA